MDEPWTIGRLLTWTADFLKQHGSESPRLDAEVLLAHARGCQRIELYTCFDDLAPDDLREKFRRLVRERSNGKPVAYLVGHREFYSRDFLVTPDVLIPRPETEFLLVALLDHVNQHHTKQAALSIVDIGTGSGILAICAALELPNAALTAIDVSAAALRVAQQNAEKHRVQNRIRWFESDLFAQLDAHEKYDVILSNPPYVAESERHELSRDVLAEPEQALFAGEFGLNVLERLLAEAPKRLNNRGRLFIEFSPPQRESLVKIGDANGLKLMHTVEDLSKRTRVLEFAK